MIILKNIQVYKDRKEGREERILLAIKFENALLHEWENVIQVQIYLICTAGTIRNLRRELTTWQINRYLLKSISKQNLMTLRHLLLNYCLHSKRIFLSFLIQDSRLYKNVFQQI